MTAICPAISPVAAMSGKAPSSSWKYSNEYAVMSLASSSATISGVPSAWNSAAIEAPRLIRRASARVGALSFSSRSALSQASALLVIRAPARA